MENNSNYLMRPRLIIIITFVFWLVVGGMIIRTNRLLFPPVMFRWSTLTQPNAVFRWATAPVGSPVTIQAQSKRSFKVTVPRRFSRGQLVITSVTGPGVLSAGITAPVGKKTIIGSAQSGGTIILPLVWDNIAMQTRTFNVDLTADSYPVVLRAVSMTLSP